MAPSEHCVIYAGGQVGGTGAVYRSTDFGRTWLRTAGSPPDTVFCLAAHPTDRTCVYAACPAGLFRSTNSGAGWTNANAGTGFRSVRFFPGACDTIVAGGDNGAVISTDGGATWTDISAGLEGTRVSCLAFTDQGQDALIAGTRGASCWAWVPNSGRASPKPETRNPDFLPSIIRGVLRLPRDMTEFGSANSDRVPRPALLDIGGRKVLDLRPGPNDVSRLAPGVYFVRVQGPGAGGQGETVEKVVIQR